MGKQKLLVSVRGINEALAAVLGGAHIADVEYPGSALGTPYPLNIKAVRDALDNAEFKKIPISTNIGEKQNVRSNSCQAALGVAFSGAQYIKLGFAGLDFDKAKYLGTSLVRTVKYTKWLPQEYKNLYSKKKVYPAVFPEAKFASKFHPLNDGPRLVEAINCDGLLIDTYKKNIGMGLLDYYTIKQLKKFVDDLHNLGKEAWLAGSITKEQLPQLWETGVDVICVRGAACEKTEGNSRFGVVKKEIVNDLISTMKEG